MDEPDFEALAGRLAVLANPRRLELLAQLAEPTPLADIRLRPSRAGAHSPERAVTRTAVEKHVRLLQDAGLVASRPGPGRGRAFALDRLALARLVAGLQALAPPAAAAPFPPGPCLVALAWPDAGRAFALAGAHDQGWVVGAHAQAEVSLPHDPDLAPRHFAVVPRGRGFALRVLAAARHNGAALAAGAEAPLARGDVVEAGRSVLLFRT